MWLLSLVLFQRWSTDDSNKNIFVQINQPCPRILHLNLDFVFSRTHWYMKILSKVYMVWNQLETSKMFSTILKRLCTRGRQKVKSLIQCRLWPIVTSGVSMPNDSNWGQSGTNLILIASSFLSVLHKIINSNGFHENIMLQIWVVSRDYLDTVLDGLRNLHIVIFRYIKIKQTWDIESLRLEKLSLST